MEQMTMESAKHQTNRYVCLICLKIFFDRKPYLTHVNTHLVRPVTCHICGKSLTTKGALKAHMASHEKRPVVACYSSSFVDVEQTRTDPVEVKPEWYQCLVCSKMFSVKKRYQKHLNTHLIPPVECHICGKSLTTKFGLKVHMASHENKRAFACTLCDFKGNTMHSINSHMKNKHIKRLRYGCDLCEKKYVMKSELTNHIEIVHEGLTLVCGVCKKIFTDKYYYRRHLKIHEPDKRPSFPCELCSKVFMSEKSLKKHVVTHVDLIGQHVCDVCGKTFKFIENLRHHKKTHDDEKTYVCEHCGKSFLTACTLKTHQRVHTKEKPYKCKWCEKCFSQRSPLIIHTRLHTGERPYSCEICSKKFVSRSALKSHRCQGYGDD